MIKVLWFKVLFSLPTINRWSSFFIIIIFRACRTFWISGTFPWRWRRILPGWACRPGRCRTPRRATWPPAGWSLSLRVSEWQGVSHPEFLLHRAILPSSSHHRSRTRAWASAANSCFGGVALGSLLGRHLRKGGTPRGSHGPSPMLPWCSAWCLPGLRTESSLRLLYRKNR